MAQAFPEARGKMQVGGWTVIATQDGDGHLSVIVENEDQSNVLPLEAPDNSQLYNSIAPAEVRFSTEAIETAAR